MIMNRISNMKIYRQFLSIVVLMTIIGVIFTLCYPWERKRLLDQHNFNSDRLAIVPLSEDLQFEGKHSKSNPLTALSGEEIANDSHCIRLHIKGVAFDSSFNI